MTMAADRGDTSDDDGGDDDDDDDGIHDNALLATQPPAQPPLLSRVYDVELPDPDVPDTSNDRGNTVHRTLNDTDACPS